MREFIKVLSVVVFMFAAPTAAITWLDDRPTMMVSILRYVSPILALLGIALFLMIHLRADLAPDYLYEHVGTYFNRGSFCFGIRPTVLDGVCYFNVYFQNQQDRPCIGRVALRPARGFFLGRVTMDTIALEIGCTPAAFGVASVAIPIPAKLQGKRLSFEVGASVDYPKGKGRTLRFRDGIVLRANSNFGNSFGTALMIAGALTGHIVLSTPATVKVDLPAGVTEEVSGDLAPKITTFWQLGDAPLQAAVSTRSPK